METRKLLQRFIDLLKDENRYIIESIKDKTASENLTQTIQKKEELLRQILALDKEEVEPYQEELKKIDEWTQRNKMLALNNMEFINEVFEAIFSQDSPSQYTKDGNITSKKEGFFNKKV